VYLKDLVAKMPDYLLKSRSINTVKKYENYFKKFKDFMAENNKESLPARSSHVSLFIVHLLTKNVSRNVISSLVYSIKWKHNLYGYSDPTSDIHVKDLLSTSNRRIGKPVCKKDVIDPEHIRLLCQKYSDSEDLFVTRDIAMIVMCFSGFLRFDELSNIKCNEISFETGYVKVTISKSKTDQFRNGNEVLLSKLDSVACPFKALEKYVKFSGVDLSSSNFLFRAMYRTKSKTALRHKVKKLSYTRTKEVLLARIKEVTPQGLDLGLHTFRASGATAAAKAGVNQRCFKRHGRWRSNAVEGYVQDSLKKRLEVTQKLGL
jgi:site-specific recombinase XerD